MIVCKPWDSWNQSRLRLIFIGLVNEIVVLSISSTECTPKKNESISFFGIMNCECYYVKAQMCKNDKFRWGTFIKSSRFCTLHFNMWNERRNVLPTKFHSDLSRQENRTMSENTHISLKIFSRSWFVSYMYTNTNIKQQMFTLSEVVNNNACLSAHWIRFVHIHIECLHLCSAHSHDNCTSPNTTLWQMRAMRYILCVRLPRFVLLLFILIFEMRLFA